MFFNELQDLVGLMLNFTPNQTDADFTTVQVKAALNRAYDREVRAGKLRGHNAYFKSQTTLTWPASTQDMTLNALMKRSQWVRLEDITNSAQASLIEVGSAANEALVYLLDRSTLRWGSEGPFSERTLRLTYLASAEELIEDEDEPQLIPPEYHELLAYSAAIELRAFADEEIPSAWQKRYLQFQMEFWKLVTKGRPHIGGDVTVINRYPDDTAGAYSSSTTSGAAQDGSSIGKF